MSEMRASSISPTNAFGTGCVSVRAIPPMPRTQFLQTVTRQGAVPWLTPSMNSSILFACRSWVAMT